jgi:hypothetical protein
VFRFLLDQSYCSRQKLTSLQCVHVFRFLLDQSYCSRQKLTSLQPVRVFLFLLDQSYCSRQKLTASGCADSNHVAADGEQTAMEFAAI